MASSRARLVAICGLLTLCALVAVGCGNQSGAPPLGQSETISLGTMGTAKVTPFYAVHIVTYYPTSKAVPYTNPQTPVQLRQGNCLGKVIAALTDGAPAPSGTPTAVEANSGVYLPMEQTANLYVAVLAKNAPDADVLACGHPLGGARQYFDLFLPSQGANGYGRGMVMMEPIVASHVTFSVPHATSQNMNWAIVDGACGAHAKPLATAQVASGQTSSEATIYAKPNASWSLQVQPGQNAQPICKG